MQAYAEAFKGFYSPWQLLKTILTVAGGNGLSALLANLQQRLVDRCARQVGDHNTRTLTGKQDRARSSNTAGTAGDQRDLACQPSASGCQGHGRSATSGA